MIKTKLTILQVVFGILMMGLAIGMFFNENFVYPFLFVVTLELVVSSYNYYLARKNNQTSKTVTIKNNETNQVVTSLQIQNSPLNEQGISDNAIVTYKTPDVDYEGRFSDATPRMQQEMTELLDSFSGLSDIFESVFDNEQQHNSD